MDPDTDCDPNEQPYHYALSSKIVLTAVILLLTAILLILSLHLYLRWRMLRRRSHRRDRLIFDGEALGRRGLDPAVLTALPVVVFFAAGDGDGAVAECAVCLSEFEDGEKVRSLPQCGHRFHIDCVDMWFRSHDTCPLCRSVVEAGPHPPPPPPPQVADAVAPTEPEWSLQADPCPACPVVEGVGSLSADASGPEVRIEVAARGAADELGLGLKSPGSRKLSVRILSRDLRLHHGGGSVAEADLERGEGAKGAPPPPPPWPPGPGF